MNMKEKLARAALASVRDNASSHSCIMEGSLADTFVEADINFLVLVDAVLAALRDPTEEMIEAGFECLFDPCDRESMVRAWRGMVGAISLPEATTSPSDHAP